MPFRPTDEDEKLWGFAIKGARQYKKANKPAREVLSATKIKKKNEKQRIDPSPAPATSASTGQQEPQLNRRDMERLRKGQMEIEARLDLHGMRQDQARTSLERFIRESHAKKYRCILVITGKGTLSSPSVLRQNLPEWLRDQVVSPYVLKWTQAHIKDGGTGAFYVYLKRK